MCRRFQKFCATVLSRRQRIVYSSCFTNRTNINSRNSADDKIVQGAIKTSLNGEPYQVLNSFIRPMVLKFENPSNKVLVLLGSIFQLFHHSVFHFW